MSMYEVKNSYVTIVLLITVLLGPIQVIAVEPFLVKDIQLTQNTSDGLDTTPFALSGNTLFFVSENNLIGSELWKYEGGSASLIKDINPGGPYAPPTDLTDVNGTLFFVANDGANGKELWRSDGTEAGTYMVKDINESGDSSPSCLANIDGTLYFNANDGVNGAEIWKSDGTVAGTFMIKDINPGANSGGGCYFTVADDAVAG